MDEEKIGAPSDHDPTLIGIGRAADNAIARGGDSIRGIRDCRLCKTAADRVSGPDRGRMRMSGPTERKKKTKIEMKRT